MTTAKVFMSGNSQAIRLPKTMRLDANEVEVVRHGDTLIVRPLRPQTTLASAFDALARIGDDFLPEGRQQGESQERETF
ncbi:AbrB/MazE/SpoVT family DNA-binding domain-containing protein (plasmid) [Deinococcus psychrotolerans]|uniref:AbrB/MazE/SpoVT family DNA-binding domain-containing protein n=1 Tax=Deinococcus psychrotolerans TaxID=2489213 RepID=A0A3G8YK07_9DEIO|nr:type II toxin-antitoxin system VapB family antitoxin [Deinococcus psychrotolerans]AZI45225.1 AbrB/MazE/SpoVT family DNA-binding domain-containing protein [Deinococcus psychrotolerans]